MVKCAKVCFSHGKLCIKRSVCSPKISLHHRFCVHSIFCSCIQDKVNETSWVWGHFLLSTRRYLVVEIEGFPSHLHHVSFPIVHTSVFNKSQGQFACSENRRVLTEGDIFGKVAFGGRQVNQLALQHK